LPFTRSLIAFDSGMSLKDFFSFWAMIALTISVALTGASSICAVGPALASIAAGAATAIGVAPTCRAAEDAADGEESAVFCSSSTGSTS